MLGSTFRGQDGHGGRMCCVSKGCSMVQAGPRAAMGILSYACGGGKLRWCTGHATHQGGIQNGQTDLGKSPGDD